MSERFFSHVILGGGLAGAAAIEGIRERDTAGSIALISAEHDPPYDRPPLSKKLWTGDKQVEEIFVHPESFYGQHGVSLILGTEIVELDVRAHSLRDRQGISFRYKKLVITTGGTPRKLTIPSGELTGLSYFRTLADYRELRAAATSGKSAVVIGGGFIGSELAASLCLNGVHVTMISPEEWIVARVFPESLGRALTDYYRSKGVTV